MAAVEVVMPPPPPPPPPVPVVRISRVAMVAADAVVCLWIASLWFLLASLACALIGLLACGRGCTVNEWIAVLVSLLLVLIVGSLASLLLNKFEEAFHYLNQLEKGAAALEPISEAVVNAHLIAVTAFACLEFLGFLPKLLAANDPPTARFASVAMVVPPLGICIMCCFLSIPVLAVRVWRMRGHGRASVVPI